jgi:hypothetical protein
MHLSLQRKYADLLLDVPNSKSKPLVSNNDECIKRINTMEQAFQEVNGGEERSLCDGRCGDGYGGSGESGCGYGGDWDGVSWSGGVRKGGREDKKDQ